MRGNDDVNTCLTCYEEIKAEPVKDCDTCKLIREGDCNPFCWDKPTEDMDAQKCIDHVINDKKELIPVNYCPECGRDASELH